MLIKQTFNRQMAGMSLIELITTIAVMSVLVAFVGSNMSDMVTNMRVKTAAESTMAGLQKARAEAIKQNKNLGFWLVSPAAAESLDTTCALSAASSSWVISLADPASHCDVAISRDAVNAASPYIFHKQGAGKTAQNITVSALNAAGGEASSILFDGFGQITNPVAAVRTIDFTSSIAGVRRIRIQITPAGSMRLCDRDAVSGSTSVCA
jgi:type IV fimbrial biogenesis protein FimT